MRTSNRSFFNLENRFKNISRKLIKIFPERQFYYRCNGHIRFFVFTSTKQCFLLLFFLVLSLGILGFISYTTFKTLTISSYQARMKNTLVQYRDWIAEARSKQENALQTLQQKKQDFLQQNMLMEERLASLEELVEGAMEETPKNFKSKEEARALMMSPSMAELIKRGKHISLSPDQADTTKLTQISYRQNSLLDRLENIVKKKIEKSHKALVMTGIKKNSILDLETTEQAKGTGGPLISLPQNEEKLRLTSDPVIERTKRVLNRLEESKYIQSVITSIPLAIPVTGDVKLSSPYGVRRDPFTKKKAFHNGLDFRGSWRAPVFATAPGEVVYAGWRSGYGKIIEIKHAHNFKTRYAHLSKILVQKGSKIVVGQKIGSIGSTGRSTGPHLHYEVWFKNRAYNPKKFLEAGKYYVRQ